ncbi:Uncharacterized protein dnm_033320 [Desulfonema magnum]|uniref:Uncharacterized protein n=1 Tax=Desulfonema magnum TaxID=45655 RepID=A0A975BL59_9BACT|nr:Uncharacterized protein dnm_033320 [Desulfonema magnum]
MPGKETRLFSRNDPRPVTKKAGFLPRSRKKRCIKKLLLRYLYHKTAKEEIEIFGKIRFHEKIA